MPQSKTGSSNTTDPVELLLRNARDGASSGGFRVTGVMMQYYFVCERELWFLSRNVEIDRDNPNIVRGTRVDEESYERKKSNFHVDGNVAIDVLDNGKVVEVKPSSKLEEPARMQLLYYLWYLKKVAGVEREGVLAHPTEKEREEVKLTEENEEKVEEAIRGIHEIVNSETPPPAEEKPFCDSCAYYDFCWSC
jgi:CRISPR-associated exonuclease Cas4